MAIRWLILLLIADCKRDLEKWRGDPEGYAALFRQKRRLYAML